LAESWILACYPCPGPDAGSPCAFEAPRWLRLGPFPPRGFEGASEPGDRAALLNALSQHRLVAQVFENFVENQQFHLLLTRVCVACVMQQQGGFPVFF